LNDSESLKDLIRLSMVEDNFSEVLRIEAQKSEGKAEE
jgi:hypothetical protein